jgi:hypothetical protein
MEGYLGIDHYWVRAADYLGKDANHAESRAMYLCEQFLTYDAAKATITEAEKMLLTVDGKAKLKTQLLEHYKKVYSHLADEAIENLCDEAIAKMARRAARVDKVLQRLNLRQGLPIYPLHQSDASWPRMRLFDKSFNFESLRRAA